MKTAILLALVGAVAVCAQDAPAAKNPPPNAPQCVLGCIDGMWRNIHEEFQCNENDVKCACANEKGTQYNFGHGVWDCSRHCPTVDDANIGVQWGNKVCSDVGVAVNITLVTAADLIVDSGSSGSTTTPPTAPNASVTPSPVATTTFTTVTTPGSGDPLTSTVTSTVLGINGVPVPAASGSATVSAGGGTSAATTGSAVASTDTGNTATQSSPAATTSSSSGLGSQATAAPMAGLLAAAGLVAALL